MKRGAEPFGRLLLRAGVLGEDALADILDQQRHPLPLGSLCLALGYADEDVLCRALSQHKGVPGVVLSQSVIPLSILAGLPRDLLQRHVVLPVYEDKSRLFVATEDPANSNVLRELGWLRGKAVVPHVALKLAISRAMRQAFRALDRGETYWLGEGAVAARVVPRPGGRMHVISDVEEVPSDVDDGSLQETLQPTHPGDWGTVDEDKTGSTMIDFDAEMGESTAGGSAPTPVAGVTRLPRILVVDDDFATRQLLVKMLSPQGCLVDTASSGMEAINSLRASPPELVILDVMLPEVDGLQICRSIKSSKKYRHIPVMMLSAMMDAGSVSEEVLQRHGADAFFEKPLDVASLKAKAAELLARRVARPPVAEDGTFEAAVVEVRAGRIDEAIDLLRAGLAHDPLSTKHHFALANLLQRKNLVYESIDAYEATVNLRPDYFPALSRLAFLYYKQGFSLKAIETWRRSLPHCPEAALRDKIEKFMRKLIHRMQADS